MRASQHIYQTRQGFARELFNRTFASQVVRAGQIIVYADNGKPKRSQTLKAMFEHRGILL